MRHTTTRAALALAAAAALSLTACTSSSDHGTAPAKTSPPATTTTAPAPVTPDKAALIKACIDAINAGRDDGDGAPECTSLSTEDYYEAIHERNQAAIKKFQEDTDRAASATP